MVRYSLALARVSTVGWPWSQCGKGEQRGQRGKGGGWWVYSRVVNFGASLRSAMYWISAERRATNSWESGDVQFEQVIVHILMRGCWLLVDRG